MASVGRRRKWKKTVEANSSRIAVAEKPCRRPRQAPSVPGWRACPWLPASALLSFFLRAADEHDKVEDDQRDNGSAEAQDGHAAGYGVEEIHGAVGGHPPLAAAFYRASGLVP